MAPGPRCGTVSTNINPAIPGTLGTGVEIHALATATGAPRLRDGAVALLCQGRRRLGVHGHHDVDHRRRSDRHDRKPFGVTGGAGLEVAFLRNVSAKVEYNYLYFPEHSYVRSSPRTRDGASVDHFVHLVKAGINVRFGGDAVVARY